MNHNKNLQIYDQVVIHVGSIEKVLSRDNKIYKKMYKITYNESIKNRTSEANNKKMDR